MGSISEFASLSIFLISRFTCTGVYKVTLRNQRYHTFITSLAPESSCTQAAVTFVGKTALTNGVILARILDASTLQRIELYKKNEASFRLLVSKIYFLRDQAIQTCKEKNWGCNETCRPTINPQTWAKIVKKEKWKVHRGDRRVKTGENNEDLLFCYEVLTQSPTG